jgi:uncharacterized integral membrane protein
MEQVQIPLGLLIFLFMVIGGVMGFILGRYTR